MLILTFLAKKNRSQNLRKCVKVSVFLCFIQRIFSYFHLNIIRGVRTNHIM